MGARPGVESPQQQTQQQQPGPQVGGAPGFGRGSPVGGNFDGPNNKRRRYWVDSVRTRDFWRFKFFSITAQFKILIFLPSHHYCLLFNFVCIPTELPSSQLEAVACLWKFLLLSFEALQFLHNWPVMQKQFRFSFSCPSIIACPFLSFFLFLFYPQ